jgi:hypothetical protein
METIQSNLVKTVIYYQNQLVLVVLSSARQNMVLKGPKLYLYRLVMISDLTLHPKQLVHLLQG